MSEKFCSNCYTIKNESNFYFKRKINKFENICKICFIIKQKEYYLKNKDNISEYQKEYKQHNKENVELYHKEYRLKNQQNINNKNNNYYYKNKNKIITQHNNYNKIKRKSDINYKIRTTICAQIGTAINKNNESCLKYLPYTITELTNHLESKFEPWMNWNNHGCYVKNKWLDNNLSTWKWQIDHIIPHSFFKYTSMQDEEFVKCWALENLRPYSAKENILKSNKVLVINE